MRFLSIILICALAFSPIYGAKKSVKLAKDSYHQICQDLTDNIVKPGKKLTKSELSVVKKYLKAEKVSSLKSRDLSKLESAIKKHKFVSVVGKSKKINLSKFPEKSNIGNWYKLDSNSKPGKKISRAKGDRTSAKGDGASAK
jgi:hypothetical protein